MQYMYMQTLIAQSITCYEHGISSGLFKVSCFQNLPQPAVPPQTQQTGGSMVRLEDPGGYKSCIQYHRTKSPFRSYITIHHLQPNNELHLNRRSCYVTQTFRSHWASQQLELVQLRTISTQTGVMQTSLKHHQLNPVWQLMQLYLT